MSGTIYTSKSDGDWGAAGIWSTGAVPNAVTADVTIDTNVTVAAGKSFAGGTLDVASAGFLMLVGALEIADRASVNGHASLDGGTLGAGGGLTLDSIGSSLGGSGTLSGSIDNAGLIYAANGLLDLAGRSGSGGLEIDWATGSAATLELGQGDTEAVVFLGTANPTSAAEGVLKLDMPGAYSGTISGFTLGDAIDLVGASAATLADNFSGNGALGTLTISNASSVVASLILVGDYTNSGFTLIPDGQGGTDVELIVPGETAVADGDWSDPSIWSSDYVPNSGTTDVVIPGSRSVTIAAGESFDAGSVDIGSGPFNINLEVLGNLSASGDLTVDGGGVVVLQGSLGAGEIDIFATGVIEGTGTLASPGTLNDDGNLVAVGGLPGQTLTVTPAYYSQTSGLEADNAVLVLAPTTGPSGFLDQVNGTLGYGIYQAVNSGTLVLPAPITDVERATVVMSTGALPGTPEIVAGGTAIEASLTMLGTQAYLDLYSADYITSRTLTVNDEIINLEGGTLSPAELILSPGSGSLDGYGVASTDIENDSTIFANVGSSVVAGAILDLAESVSGSGPLEIGSGATLELGAGQFKPGRVSFSGDVFTVAWCADTR